MRGTGSLQELLGRSVIARRKYGGKRKNADDVSKVERELEAKSSGMSNINLKKEAVETSPLRTGNVRCPVCQQQFSHTRGNDFINQHIGKRITIDLNCVFCD